jgi:hypothetical protein
MLQDVVQRSTLPQLYTDGMIAAQIAGTGQDEIAHT